MAAGLGAATMAAAPGTAQAVPINPVVTTLSDVDPGPSETTLREAITQANLDNDKDIITFAASLSGDVDLGSSLPHITEPVDIEGPGATRVAIDGQNLRHPFYVNPDAGEDVSISGLTIKNGNSGATSGSGIFNQDADLTVSDSTLAFNIGANYGGGIASYQGSLTVNRTTITGGFSNLYGGGIYVGSGPLSVSDSTISDNSVGPFGEGGGGIFTRGGVGSVNIVNTTVSGNDAESNGGGIKITARTGDVNITGSTISGNTSTGGAGGIYVWTGNATPVSITNSTVSGNTAGGPGAGVFIRGNSTTEHATITSSTIAGNTSSANFGGGITAYDPGGNPNTVLRNSIVAGNVAPASVELSGSFDVAYSIIQRPSGAGIFGPGPSFGLNPYLEPLADNGGPTKTHAITQQSPAFDAGSAFGLTVDQRGLTRPIDVPLKANNHFESVDGTDIGAFELQPKRCAGQLATREAEPGQKTVGTFRREVIVGTSGRDRIHGRGGRDLICGLGGGDLLRGDGGKDRLLGGKGRDRLIGGPGRDRLKGGPGRDLQRQ